MLTSPLLSRLRLPCIGLTAAALSSCAIPPREAWQEIQSRGLITYYMSKSAGGPLMSSPSPSQQVAYTAPQRQQYHRQMASATTPVRGNADSGMPIARVVPELPGYVRSPYTNPGRLVDVRGMPAGARVVCPYTQKPFLVPAGMGGESAPHIVADSSSPPKTRSSIPVPVPNTNVAAMT